MMKWVNLCCSIALIGTCMVWGEGSAIAGNDYSVCGGERKVKACPRPRGWCKHKGEKYRSVDCNGDGALDHVCTNAQGARGLILSGKQCRSIWPYAARSLCVPAFGKAKECPRPRGWCFGRGEKYRSYDCNGDGVLDHICTNNRGARGMILSPRCRSVWPKADRSLCVGVFGWKSLSPAEKKRHRLQVKRRKMRAKILRRLYKSCRDGYVGCVGAPCKKWCAGRKDCIRKHCGQFRSLQKLCRKVRASCTQSVDQLKKKWGVTNRDLKR